MDSKFKKCKVENGPELNSNMSKIFCTVFVIFPRIYFPFFSFLLSHTFYLSIEYIMIQFLCCIIMLLTMFSGKIYCKLLLIKWLKIELI